MQAKALHFVVMRLALNALAELLLLSQHASVLKHSKTHCSTTSEVCRCTFNDCIGMLLCHVHAASHPSVVAASRTTRYRCQKQHPQADAISTTDQKLTANNAF